jgi:hypothetical protein
MNKLLDERLVALMAGRRELLSGVEIILGQRVVTDVLDVTVRTEVALAEVVQAVDDGDAEVLDATDQEFVSYEQPINRSSAGLLAGATGFPAD